MPGAVERAAADRSDGSGLSSAVEVGREVIPLQRCAHSAFHVPHRFVFQGQEGGCGRLDDQSGLARDLLPLLLVPGRHGHVTRHAQQRYEDRRLPLPYRRIWPQASSR
jgi:hypothetical protein